MFSKVGRSPTQKVERPMNTIVVRKVYFLPVESPIRPKKTAPNGLIT
jgi:hypothetical protein